jgi:hypothetical protein
MLANRESHPPPLLLAVESADFSSIFVPWLNEKGIDLE